jgi:hypothetical protein
MGDLTKAQLRRLRDLGVVAHERDLTKELATLDAEFRRWRAGEIDAFDLADAIHRFHDGPARKLNKKYATMHPDFEVAHALHRGVLSEEEAGADLVEALRRHLAFLKENAS